MCSCLSCVVEGLLPLPAPLRQTTFRGEQASLSLPWEAVVFLFCSVLLLVGGGQVGKRRAHVAHYFSHHVFSLFPLYLSPLPLSPARTTH